MSNPDSARAEEQERYDESREHVRRILEESNQIADACQRKLLSNIAMIIDARNVGLIDEDEEGSLWEAMAVMYSGSRLRVERAYNRAMRTDPGQPDFHQVTTQWAYELRAAIEDADYWQHGPLDQRVRILRCVIVPLMSR